jgi:hypothetical protein
MFTFAAVVIGAYIDYRNTKRAIARDERSSHVDPTRGPQTDGISPLGVR